MPAIAEVEKFEEVHPLGTKARLTLALLLYTGQRCSDIILFGKQHVSQGWFADHGASENQIMAITDHQTSKEVNRYTKAARQKVLAKKVAGMLGPATSTSFKVVTGKRA